MNERATAWGGAIGLRNCETGRTIVDVADHIRSAVIEGGFVTRSRITIGLKESYSPFSFDPAQLKDLVDEALEVLCLIGDIEEFHTTSSRAYAATPARVVDLSGGDTVLLGAIRGVASTTLVRRLSKGDSAGITARRMTLSDELGRPAWKTALVDLGGQGKSTTSSIDLYRYASNLAAGGDRYVPDDSLAVLSGRGTFFGKVDPTLTGRWERLNKLGTFAGIITAGYSQRNVVVHASQERVTVWEPPSRDIWRWIVVGATRLHGDEVHSYNSSSTLCKFHTPPPKQLERIALLCGQAEQTWSWKLSPEGEEYVRRFM